MTVRSVQRSLETLSAVFTITSEMRGRANHWCWTDPHALTQIPAMSEHAAFVLRLASEYLKPLMPGAALRSLAPYFKQADRVLGGTKLGRWVDRARIIERGPPLVAPRVADDVQETVYAGLMENRRVDVSYRSRSRTRTARLVLNPLGIVVRAGVVYLVATSWDYEDLRHYALNRMSRPALLPEAAKAPAGFRLASHIQQFSYPLNPDRLELSALFAPEVRTHVMESRLAPDQRTTTQDDGRVLVEASVADTADLRWWLLSFGAGVEVLSPETLRDEFRCHARGLQSLYQLEDSR